jgi:predicted ester cyclase
MGIPPTGKRVDVELIDIMQFNDAGSVREHWGVMDTMAMMQQLGVAPAAPTA